VPGEPRIVFDAFDIVGNLFPTVAGTRLADKLLDLDQPLDAIAVDLTRCAPAMLIGGFFNAVLQAVHDRCPEKLDSARKIQWRLAHEFQREQVRDLMTRFRPW
jgi:hypothetical protein